MTPTALSDPFCVSRCSRRRVQITANPKPQSQTPFGSSVTKEMASSTASISSLSSMGTVTNVSNNWAGAAVLMAPVKADPNSGLDLSSIGRGPLIAANSDGIYSDGSIPWVTNGGEAKAAGQAGPINAPSGMLIYHGTPPGSQVFTLPNGQTFLAPAGTDFSAVQKAGAANGSINVIGINDAVGHWGTYDFQRNGGQGNLGDSRNVFYTQYTDASNYAVGVFMNGAGYSLQGTLDVAGTFASLRSSNAGSAAQSWWQTRGWYAAQHGAPNGKGP